MNYEQTLEAIVTKQSNLIDKFMNYMADNPNGEAGRLMVEQVGPCLVECRGLAGECSKPTPDTYQEVAEDYVLQVKGQNLD